MIVNVRGTHGSGKSQLVKAVLDKYHGKPLQPPGSRKPDGYECLTPKGRLYVVGSYKTACGGCDGIQPYALIWPRVVAYAAKGDVLFEGALVSNSYGNIGRDSESYGDEFVFAFMDTPYYVCVQRILERRKVNGNNKPFDPTKSVLRIHKTSKGVMRKCRELDRRWVELNHKDPLPQLLSLLALA